MFRPDSSTESNNDQPSPVDRRMNAQRYGKDNNSSTSSADKRANRNRKHQQQQQQINAKDSLERRLCPGSNNR